MVKITLYFCRIYEFAAVSVGSWCCGTVVGATRCIKKLLATVLLYSVSETLPPFGISKTIRWVSRTFSYGHNYSGFVGAFRMKNTGAEPPE